MIIGIGVPIANEGNPFIGMVVFSPGGEHVLYNKQILHEDELNYFDAGNHQHFVNIGDLKIGLSICYESLQEVTIKNLKSDGANIYLASVAKAKSGVEKALVVYQKFSKKYQIPVLMVNSIGPCDNFVAYGSSVVFDSTGLKVGSAPSNKESLLIYNTSDNSCKLILE